MKLPKLFTEEKNLDAKVDRLLAGRRCEGDIAESLLSLGEEFIKRFLIEDGDEKSLYKMAEGMIADKRYNIRDIEELSERIVKGQHHLFGIYLSALINKVIQKQDRVRLKLEEAFDYVGMRLEQGTIIVEGNTRIGAGHLMAGGDLVIKGNAHNMLGWCMYGGTITLEGSAMDLVGDTMKGGRIIVMNSAHNSTGNSMLGGSIVIGGDVNDQTGCYMNGGRLTVRGDANDSTAMHMSRGSIIIKGDANNSTGYKMRGGKLIVEGKIRNISPYTEGGIIIQGTGAVKRK